MLVSLNWLSEFCHWPDTETLVNDLNRIGFEVESWAKKGSDLSHIVVGKINEFSNHPDAERLRIAMVDIGSETIQIVTAADNVKNGDKIPVSLPGATLSGGLKIKKGKLRGVESNGMMCSAVECGLTDTSPGVWVLPPDVPIGHDFIELAHLVDTVLDIAILPNRGDALSYIGLARECQALYGTTAPIEQKELPVSKTSSGIQCQMDPSIGDYYRAQKITGINNKHTPIMHQTRLYYSGYRPISWIVDVTNIAMAETGQPLHAFDARKVDRIDVMYGTGESIELLNEKTYALTNTIPVVKINNAIGAVAGVMGANQHAVDSDTTDIVLESAQFDATIVRKATKTLGLRSESSNRFEKHVDSGALMCGVRRAYELLRLHDDIHVFEANECGQLNAPTKTIDIQINRINQLLGTGYTIDDVRTKLKPLGFQCEGTQMTVPSWRTFDCSEWPDIAEELCRLSGIEDVSPVPIKIGSHVAHHPMWRVRQRIHSTAIQMGLTEVVPFPLSENVAKDQPLILNPISPELAQLRSTGVSSLLDIAAFNASRHQRPCHIFSIGPVWSNCGKESTHVSALIQGTYHYQPHLPSHSISIDFFDVKGMVDQLLEGHVYDTIRSTSPWLHPGQGADILINNKTIGFFGMIHPSLTDGRRLMPSGYIELNLDQLPAGHRPQYEPVSKYPSTSRDVTYIMKEDTSVGDALRILLDHKPKECDTISLCGYYKKENSNEVNVSFRMVYQDNSRSLEMDAVNKIHKTFAEEVIEKLPCRFP